MYNQKAANHGLASSELGIPHVEQHPSVSPNCDSLVIIMANNIVNNNVNLAAPHS